MNRPRPPVVRIGDIVTVDEGRYCFGLGPLTVEVIEVGARERHTDGLAGYLLDAALDLRHLPADELYARFLGWVT